MTLILHNSIFFILIPQLHCIICGTEKTLPYKIITIAIIDGHRWIVKSTETALLSI